MASSDGDGVGSVGVSAGACNKGSGGNGGSGVGTAIGIATGAVSTSVDLLSVDAAALGWASALLAGNCTSLLGATGCKAVAAPIERRTAAAVAKRLFSSSLNA